MLSCRSGVVVVVVVFWRTRLDEMRKCCKDFGSPGKLWMDTMEKGKEEEEDNKMVMYVCWCYNGPKW